MILRSLIRAVYGVDVFEAVFRAERAADLLRKELTLSENASREAGARARRFWQERDAALDQVASLKEDLDAVMKTNNLLRSLVSILRLTNQNLDERLIDIERRHGMPAPAADAGCASEPDRR